eukprot:352122-Chlamydomonas_euryale.AAC.7
MVSRVAAVAILALAAGAAAESAASAPVVARGGGVEGEKPWFCHGRGEKLWGGGPGRRSCGQQALDCEVACMACCTCWRVEED